MEKTENQNGQSSRDKLMARAKEWYPDRRFTSENGQNGQNGQEETLDDLDAAIDEKISELLTSQQAFNEKDARLKALLRTDPEAAEWLQAWIETGDPRAAFYQVFGDEFGIDEENAQKFKTQLDDWRRRKSENDSLNAEASENWVQSLKDLDEWGDEKGLNPDQKQDVMVRLVAIAANGIVDKYTKDDFDLALNAINHDSDVESARQAGEVTGRNAKIAAARRERGTAETMPPARPGGQGGTTRERRPSEEKQSIWGMVNNS